MSKWIRAFAQTTTYLGVVMIAAIWGGIYFLSTEAHDRAYEDGLRQGSNMARVFEEYISRAISGIELFPLALASTDGMRGCSPTTTAGRLTLRRSRAKCPPCARQAARHS